MQCAACGTENDAGSRFCMTCGAPLAAAPADGPAGAPTIDEAPSGETASPGDQSGPNDTEGADITGAPGADRPSPFAPSSPSSPMGDPTPPPSSAADATPPPPSAGEADPPAPGDATPPPPSWGQPAADSPPPPPPAPTAWPTPPAATPPAATPSGGAPAAWNPTAAPPAPPAWGAPPAPPAPVPPAPAWGAPPGPPPGPASPPAWATPGAPAAPAAPAWGQPPAAPTGPQGYAPQAPIGPADPNGLGAAAGRSGKGPLKQARTALAVAGAVLQDDEVVEALVVGRFEGNGAVLALTDRSLVLVDDRTWRPATERFPLDATLQVQGWQDDRTASLTIVASGRQLVVDQITDRPLAVELAQRIRYRTGS